MAIRTSNSHRIRTKHLSQLTSGVVQFRSLVEDRGRSWHTAQTQIGVTKMNRFQEAKMERL